MLCYESFKEDIKNVIESIEMLKGFNKFIKGNEEINNIDFKDKYNQKIKNALI